MDVYEAFIKSGADDLNLDTFMETHDPIDESMIRMVEPTKLRINLARINEQQDQKPFCDETSSTSSSFSDGSESPMNQGNLQEGLSYGQEVIDMEIVTNDVDDGNNELEDDPLIDVENDDDEEGQALKSTSREKQNTIWDFDVMMEKRKLEKARGRPRKHKGIDLINDEDGKIIKLVEAMRHAAKEDRHSNAMKRPAFQKRKLLVLVKSMLLKSNLLDAMIDNGLMTVIAEWLAPLPDKSLPCFEIRTTILKSLQSYQLEQGTLRQSGLGKAVMLLYKHPKETRENQLLAQKLIHEWARPIFGIPTDFGSLTREDRRKLDYEHMPVSRKMEKRSHESSNVALAETSSSSQNAQHGDYGTPKSYLRAKVPKISHTDYVFRPKDFNNSAKNANDGEDDDEEEEEEDNEDLAMRSGKHRLAMMRVKRMKKTKKSRYC